MPFPSTSQAPSHWFAATAPPHKKPFGKSTLSPLMLFKDVAMPPNVNSRSTTSGLIKKVHIPIVGARYNFIIGYAAHRGRNYAVF